MSEIESRGTIQGPLRIAMISYYMPSASKMGIGYQVDRLATELVRRGHTVDVFSECPPVPDAAYGYRHIRVPGALRTFRFAWALRQQDFSSYDVIHANGDDYWLWRRRVPRHVRTLHGSCFEEALRITGLKERARMVLLGLSELLASVVADKTVAVSPQTRHWYPWVRDVIPNGVDVARFHPAPQRRSPNPTVLFVGAWHGRKCGARLADVFTRRVREALPHAELRMVAPDVPADPGCGVLGLGILTDADLVRAYQEAWVFCLPSSYEGFGIPYIEAMASGLPVVATPNVGAKYVTGQGAYGVLASWETIGDELIALLSARERREEMAAAGRERAQEFALASVADAYVRLYRASESSARRFGQASPPLRYAPAAQQLLHEVDHD